MLNFVCHFFSIDSSFCSICSCLLRKIFEFFHVLFSIFLFISNCILRWFCFSICISRCWLICRRIIVIFLTTLLKVSCSCKFSGFTQSFVVWFWLCSFSLANIFILCYFIFFYSI